jgi:hypothetical protein
VLVLSLDFQLKYIFVLYKYNDARSAKP